MWNVFPCVPLVFFTVNSTCEMPVFINYFGLGFLYMESVGEKINQFKFCHDFNVVDDFNGIIFTYEIGVSYVTIISVVSETLVSNVSTSGVSN